MDNFNKLTPAETERLAILAEECGEVVQAVSKILRFGFEDVNPLVDDGQTCRERLEQEIGDVQASICILAASKDIDMECIDSWFSHKLIKVFKWTHHNTEESVFG